MKSGESVNTSYSTEYGSDMTLGSDTELSSKMQSEKPTRWQGIADSVPSKETLGEPSYAQKVQDTGSTASMLSPMQSEDGSTKPVRTESKHSKLKNSTVLRNLNIRNSSNTVVNLRAVTENDGDSSSELSYNMPIVEDLDQFKLKKKGRGKAGKDRRFKYEARKEKWCASCKVYEETVTQLESQLTETKEQLKAVQQEHHCYQRDCEKLQKQLNDNLMMRNGRCQSCVEMLKELKKSLEKDISDKTIELAELKKELNVESRKKDDMMFTMNAQLMTEREAHHATVVSLETKFKEFEEKLLDEQNLMRLEKETLLQDNAKLEQQCKQLKMAKEDSEQEIAALGNCISNVMKDNEELTYEKNLEFKEFQEGLLHERKKEQKLMQSEKERLLQDIAKLEQQLKMAEENSEREIAALRNRISSLMKENKELRCEKNLEVGQLKEALESSRRKTVNQSKITDNMANEIDNQENQVTNLQSYSNHLQLIIALQEREFWALHDEFRRFVDGLRFYLQREEEQVAHELRYFQLPEGARVLTVLNVRGVSYDHVPPD